MLTILIVIVAILAFVELYSLGVYSLAKKMGYSNPQKVFIPFYCFKVTREITGPFTVLTIPVTKMAGTCIFVVVVTVLALIYAVWGSVNLPATSAESLWQIMSIIFAVCGLVFYLTLIGASIKIYRRFNVRNEGLFLALSLIIVTMPVLYVIASKNNPRTLDEMY